ncbi:MAG TPA: hypothetical protein VMA73_05730, partial [Streptosporangiaceae bacterium]|nr:hypothetical protein [Streptosporangiaceae bacterium]
MSEEPLSGRAGPEPAPPDAVRPPDPVRPSESAPFDADEPWVLSAAEVAALPLGSEEPLDLDDVPWWLTDEFFGTDEGEQAAWLRGLPA